MLFVPPWFSSSSVLVLDLAGVKSQLDYLQQCLPGKFYLCFENIRQVSSNHLPLLPYVKLTNYKADNEFC